MSGFFSVDFVEYLCNYLVEWIHTCNFQSSFLGLYAPGLELCGFQSFIILLVCHYFSLSEDTLFCLSLVLVTVASFLV